MFPGPGDQVLYCLEQRRLGLLHLGFQLPGGHQERQIALLPLVAGRDEELQQRRARILGVQ